MDELLVHLLAETQSSAEIPRKQAEQQLQNLYYDESFPLSLCTVASNLALPLPIRQSALVTLKNFVLAGWSPQIDDFRGQTLVPEANKDAIRNALLSLATSGTSERKIQSAASYVVAKIAAADFPDHWGGLLPSLVQLVPVAEEASLHGALKVLADLVEDGLNEKQFFGVAEDLVNALSTVAQNEGRSPGLRALAVSVFKGCFDTLEMVLEDHKEAVKTFAGKIIGAWMPLLKDTMRRILPEMQESQEYYNGHVALKLQVVKVLMKIRMLFPAIISPQSVELFSATWEELTRLQERYQKTYIDDDQEGRLEDADGLPYTLDFLVLEDLDFMQGLIRAPPVRQKLQAQFKASDHTNGSTSSNWVLDVVKLIVSYAQITTEEDGMWQCDVNVFLSEETSVTANYTTRTACGDFMIKIGEWLPTPTTEALLFYMKALFSNGGRSSSKEAVLYLLNQLLVDWCETEHKIDSSTASTFLEFAHNAIQQPEVFLRARGFAVAAAIVKAAGEPHHQTGASLLELTLRSTIEDSSDIVQVSCIRALQHYLSSLPPTYTAPLQNSVLSALSQWIATQDLSELSDSDDLMITLVETLRDAILLDTRVALTGEGLKVLFNVASKGAANFQIVALVTEVFEEICSTIAALGNDSYAHLCDGVLPSLMGAFDVVSIEEENPLTNLAADLLTSLTHHATSPLPPHFVSVIYAKISPHILHSTSPELLKATTQTIRNMLQNDPLALLSSDSTAANANTPSDQSGIESLLVIISHLLSSAVPDSAASEVGGLAAELVEKAGAERLGPYLPQLLQAIAVRLASATQAQMIQSLIIVFARLCLASPREVIDFLAQLEIPSPVNAANAGDHNSHITSTTTSALHTVLPTWLSSSSNFVGYAAINTNIQALVNIYRLHDPRVASLTVKGDLIPSAAQNGRIMTRSRARQNPDTWTNVGADIKILKVLVEELATPNQDGIENAAIGAAGASARNDNEDDDDEDGDFEDEGDDWEDEPGILDLGLGSTRAELMAYAEDETASARGRRNGGDDDETQRALVEFFRELVRQDGFEGEVWSLFTEREKERVKGVVG